ncbi:asparagine synthase C-terminal domain-containing protein [Halohasta litorea]|uniref:Asparagine synthase C-terminal domain-containing protein n=1 Tax=Halohasta litorea TaxID=869891 RepID=A0ABD6D671_9EURY|nr:asparagine synthase-related protein [Halohasta litorea]
MTETLRGGSLSVVRATLADADPLPGASGRGPGDMGGFGGVVDGQIVRDVLGRQPIYTDADAVDPVAEGAWAFAPTELETPAVVPPGAVRTVEGDSQRLELPEPPADSPETAQAAVSEALTDALGLDGADRPTDTAVAFSGGIDSALVAAGLPDAPLYVIGFEGSHDIAAAREAADAMGRTADLHVIELDHARLQEAVPRVADAINRTNPMDVSIALPLLLVAERAVEDGYDRLALGQGADELFGGYSKVVDPSDDHRVEAETVRGAVRETITSLPDQLERDVCGLQAVGVEPVTPFLQDRVVDAALRLPGERLASGEERKIALRAFARREGVLPELVASTDKKAVQYGSYVSRELDRLARQAGYKRRMDDHVGQYIRSLLLSS